MEKAEEKLRKLAAVDPERADALWKLFLLGHGEERQEAEELIDVLLDNEIGKDFDKGIFLEPPSHIDCHGDYDLGQVMYPETENYGPFGLHENEWIRHLLITGMTGAGKTNLAFHILRRFVERNKPFLIFDWKRNYRDLFQFPEFRDLTVCTVAKSAAPFRFNPLIPPPGCSPGQWLMLLVDVIKHAYFVGEGVEHLLRNAMDAVYDDCGMLDGKQSETPLMSMVRDRIVNRRAMGRESLWKASTMRVLESLCFRHGLGPVVNCRESLEPSDFLGRPIVLELDALSDADKVFLTEAIILWIYEFRKQEGKRETFKHALIIEEGHHVLSQAKETAEGAETIMETCLRQIREFGEAVIVIDQEPTKLSNSIKANSLTKIAFNLGNGKDVLEMANCMGLDREEAQAIARLKTGHAVIALKGRIPVPILVGFPHVALTKGAVPDGDLSRAVFSPPRPG